MSKRRPPIPRGRHYVTMSESIEEIAAYFDRLWPILRSITGDGVRATHEILAELVPLERIEIPTGTVALDWTVPQEWVVRDAYVITPHGERILAVTENNLHLLNYSTAFTGTVSREALVEHLHTLPHQPNAIPYVTSYYEPRWGFCIAHEELERLPPGDYQVTIDTELVDGSLTIGEAVLPGKLSDEVLISTYTCHPSLANNELSGPLVAAFLYRRLAAWPARRLTYRFVFLPETIGSVCYLARRGKDLREKLVAGYVVTCIGDAGAFTYKRSRQGDSLADRAAIHVLDRSGREARILDFFPDRGSDERQYCSPGFNLPVGSLMRTMYGTYPEYHTSLDDRSFISFEAIHESIGVYESVMRALEVNLKFANVLPFGEPQLGRRGLYDTLGTKASGPLKSAILWVLNFSDGDHDLLEIADRSGHDVHLLANAAEACAAAGLVEAR
jgi:aminopeptidase-like protein